MSAPRSRRAPARTEQGKARMPGRNFAATVLAFLSALALPAAQAGELVIPGSGNPEHVLRQLAKAFHALQPQHRVSIPPSTGTAGALRDVRADAAVLGRLGRPLTAEEQASGLAYVPLGRDPVVFVAGAGVTVDRVTREQMIDAYTGKATDWREWGGAPAPIRAVGREKGDASRQALNRAIPAFETIAYHADVKMVHLDPQALALFDRYPSSLGFLNRSALAAAATALRPLMLDGVAPTAENLASGSYPLWLELGLVHRKSAALPAEARAFLDFVASAEGRGILRSHGILPAAPGK
jgi:phosphate transport system substrate-binding protein